MEQESHLKKYKLKLDRSDVSHGRIDRLAESMIASGVMTIHDIVCVRASGCNICTHTTEEHRGCCGRIHAASQGQAYT